MTWRLRVGGRRTQQWLADRKPPGPRAGRLARARRPQAPALFQGRRHSAPPSSDDFGAARHPDHLCRLRPGRRLPDRPPLGQADDYDAALYLLAAVQEEFYDQLDAIGKGGHTAHLALALAPSDATGTLGPPCYCVTINGMRPAEL